MPSPNLVAPGDLLTVEEATALLGCSERFLRELLSRRELPVIKLGRRLKIRRADLSAYIEARRLPALRGPLAGV